MGARQLVLRRAWGPPCSHELLSNELNQQTALARGQSSTGYVSAVRAASTVGGFSLGTPNVNPLTVDSMRADAIRAQGTPMANALSLINLTLGLPSGRSPYI